MTMQTGELIQLYAEHGFMIDPMASFYFKRHDPVEILHLVQEHEPELLVINLEAIRRVKRVERKNTIVKYVKFFRARPVRTIKKNLLSFIYNHSNKIIVP